MDSYRYYELRNLAWETLINSYANKLPIDIYAIIKENGIKIKYASIKNDIGIYVKGWSNGRTIILNDKIGQSQQELRFTTAHEYGHLLLHEFVSNKIAREKEANSFAARLLMPVGVLHFAGIESAEDISRVCNVSIEAATWRAERLKLLQSRGKFATSELEQKVLDNFHYFIKNYRNKKR